MMIPAHEAISHISTDANSDPSSHASRMAIHITAPARPKPSRIAAPRMGGQAPFVNLNFRRTPHAAAVARNATIVQSHRGWRRIALRLPAIAAMTAIHGSQPVDSVGGKGGNRQLPKLLTGK